MQGNADKISLASPFNKSAGYDLLTSQLAGFSLQYPLPPHRINRRIDEQFQDEGSSNAPYHGSGNAFHDFRSGSCGPKDWYQADAHGSERHEFGPQSLGSSFHDGFENAWPRNTSLLA